MRGDREAIARPYLSEEVPTVEEAYAGARDIVAEQIAEFRGKITGPSPGPKRVVGLTLPQVLPTA